MNQMRMRRPRPIDIYVACVTTLGAALTLFFGAQGLTALQGLRPGTPLTFLFFGLFIVVGELFPIRTKRGEEIEEIAVSSTFSFAILLAMGVGPAVLAQAVATMFADLIRGKAPWKALFNVSMLTVSLVASGWVFQSLSVGPPESSVQSLVAANLGAVAASAAVFVFGNLLLTAIAFSLSEGISLRSYLRRELLFQVSVDGVLVALAPVVVVVAESSLPLIPLLALPMAAVYRSANTLLINEKLVDQLRTQAAEKEHQALHDALTGLPNRMLFRDRVEQAILSAKREDTSVAVMLMDLDRFKEINDALGHHNGDSLLVNVGARLSKRLRESDTIARLGGDEFGILLPRVPNYAAAENAASKILEALSLPFQLEDMALDIGASIGVAFYPEHGSDADELIQRADVAMYAAKELRSGYEIYAPERDGFNSDRLSLIGDLRRAIDEAELVLHYQPKAHLGTGEVKGVEALVRWQHPERGMIAPNEFIGLAEHTGLIKPLTLYVLDRAIRQCSIWHRQGLQIGVAVNLSAQNLLDVHLPEEICKLLSKWGVSPAWLELEITESSIMIDPQRAREVLGRLDAAGMRLAVDDFGTGYSSLAYLRQLPVNAIKIDKSFIMGMPTNENDAVIVRSTVELGRNLGLEVIAEGVESELVWQQLAALECDVAQGFFLNRPMPADNLTRWLLERHTTDDDRSQQEVLAL